MNFLFYILTALHLLPLFKRYYYLTAHKQAKCHYYPPFSVIVSARNEYNNLQKLLPALLAQDYAEFEIVIALDRCNDQSHELIRQFQIKFPNLKIIIIKSLPTGYSGKKYGLERAIHAAKNQWLLFTDADCVPASTAWIKTFAEQTFEHTDLIIGVSPYHQVKGLLNSFIRYETIQTAFLYITSAISGPPYMGVGRNMAYRKQLFIDHQGYSPFKHVVGGDDDLFIQKVANKTNTGVVLDKEGLTYSIPKSSIKAYMAQKTRHLHASKYYQKKIKIQLGFYVIVHFMLWVSFIYLALITPLQWAVICTFALLLTIKGFIYHMASRKMGFNYHPMFLPFSDFILGVCYPFIGIRGHFSRKIKWS